MGNVLHRLNRKQGDVYSISLSSSLFKPVSNKSSDHAKTVNIFECELITVAMFREEKIIMKY